VIEILLEGVPSVFLSDEPIDSVKLKFSFSEVLANIFQNYVDAWNAAPFPRYYFNTFLVATTTTLLEVVTASLAAYAFSWMVFPGRDFIFGLFLATMMIPGEVLLVPNFITISKLGWIDTYYALIIPWIVSVFAIFLLRQHFLTIPRELFDAAKIDGCLSANLPSSPPHFSNSLEAGTRSCGSSSSRTAKSTEHCPWDSRRSVQTWELSTTCSWRPLRSRYSPW